MTNRNLRLGRSKPSEKLSRAEIAALDTAPVPPAPTMPPPKPPKPPKATGKTGSGQQRMVRREQLKFRWSLDCPDCGFKVNGEGHPKPGQRLARCGRCKVVLVLGGGCAADNTEYVNREASMTETEMLKGLRIIVARVAHADQASGRAPVHVLQAKEKVREELVSAVREKCGAYLAPAR